MISQYENYEQILASIANDIESLNVNIRHEKLNTPYIITKYKVFMRKKEHKIKLLNQKVQILIALVKVLLKTKKKGVPQNQHIKNEYIHCESNNEIAAENFISRAIISSKTLNGTCNSELEDIGKKYLLSQEKNKYLKNKLSILNNQLKFLYEENKLLRCQIFQLGEDNYFLNENKEGNVYSKENHIKHARNAIINKPYIKQQFETPMSKDFTKCSQLFKSPVRKFKSHLSLVNCLLCSQKQFLYDAHKFSE